MVYYILRKMEETWLPIEGYNNYSVSNLGNVKNNKTNKLMKSTVKGGYSTINLINNNGDRNSFKVHRLVALAFIPNPENKSDVNHIDRNKTNNCVTNLNWMTKTENQKHKFLTNTKPITTNKNKVILRKCKDNGNILEKYNSIEEAGIWVYNNDLSSSTHTGRNSIGNCLCGLSKSAYKYLWEFENKYHDLPNEIWKQIIIDEITQDLDKKYYISNLGRFKNSYGIILDDYKINENGYKRVYILNKTYAIHRLVAYMFIENSENKEQVNHIDGNKLNNKVENLSWVTNQENCIHKFQTGLGNNYKRKICQYSLENQLIKEFLSIREAIRETKIGTIGQALQNRQKTAGGFIWKYLD